MATATEPIETTRLEAFSDGVIAVIITIMVLELKAPAGSTLHDLREVLPHFLVYMLSFQIVGTYWNNHHHMLRATQRITGKIMWLNLLLLFCLSLIPFFASWMGEHATSHVPVAAFGIILCAAAFSYFALQHTIVAAQPKSAKIASAIGEDYKGKLSGLGYFIAIPLAFVAPAIAYAIFVALGLMWFIPDRRLAA